MSILQIGLGNFGLNHLRAWLELGQGDSLRVAERVADLHQRATALRFPANQLSAAVDSFWSDAEIVDIVTGTDTHFELCRRALAEGKDVFVEKPMTMTSAEAIEIARLVHERQRVLQVGYYYRYHPISVWLRRCILANDLGDLRYMYGSFMGFKRARNDVGVMHTDGIHFIDLFNFLISSFPEDVYAVTRDHFGRGLEDLAIALFTYPGNVVARVEAGYIQPGDWRDKVVAGAMTTKSITVIGSRKTVVADYETESVMVYDVHHELREGVWAAVQGDAVAPVLPTASPLDQIRAELTDFLACVRNRHTPAADGVACGVNLALTIEALYRSARTQTRVPIELAPAPASLSTS